MCTAVTYLSRDHYFGRNLDYFHSYGEEILITPRNFPFKFRNQITLNSHFAIIGMGLDGENYPLYFDARGCITMQKYFAGNSAFRKYKYNR